MNLYRLDHFTLRTTLLAETRTFYETVVGLHPGPRPSFGFPGHWLYLGELPVLHLAAPSSDAALELYLGARTGVQDLGSGSVDHIAFRGRNHVLFERRLLGLGCAHQRRIVPELGEHQFFVVDPNGVTVEFIFPVVTQNPNKETS